MCISNVFSKDYKTGGKSKMKRNEKLRVKALRFVERITRNEAEKVSCGWPPICFGISHQPKRPKRKW